MIMYLSLPPKKVPPHFLKAVPFPLGPSLIGFCNDDDNDDGDDDDGDDDDIGDWFSGFGNQTLT